MPVMERSLTLVAPTVEEIVKVLASHPLIRLREPVLRAFVVGSFAKGEQTERSDLDILLEVPSANEKTIDEMEWRYRAALQAHFVKNNIRGVADHIHPQWAGRRVDMYFTYDADLETRPKVQLHRDRAAQLPAAKNIEQQSESTIVQVERPRA